MQELLGVVNALVQLGGWGALLLVAVAIAIGGMRRKWVWGWQYDRETARADKAEASDARNTEAIRALTSAVDTITEIALQERATQRPRRA